MDTDFLEPCGYTATTTNYPRPVSSTYLLRHSIRNNFTLYSPKLLLLLEVEWYIVAACIIEMQLRENPFHHAPIPLRFCHVLHTQRADWLVQGDYEYSAIMH